MNLYTSYFGNYKNFEENSVLFSVSRFLPKGLKKSFIELKIFAPSGILLKNYKEKKINENDFKILYIKQLKDQKEIINSFVTFLKQKQNENINIYFCCFEKKGDFCHRYFLIEFLKKEFNLTITEK